MVYHYGLCGRLDVLEEKQFPTLRFQQCMVYFAGHSRRKNTFVFVFRIRRC